MTTRTIDDNAIDSLNRQLVVLENRIKTLKNRKTINAPVYSNDSFPIGSEGDLTVAVDGFAYKYLNGSWTVVGGAAGLDSWDAKITKTIDETVVSSTVLQDDNELQIPTTTGIGYEFEFIIVATVAVGGTNNLKIKIGEDATVRGTYFVSGFFNNNTSLTGATADPPIFDTSVANIIPVKVIGSHLANGSPIKLQWAQNSSNGFGVTVKAGSFVRYRASA